MSSTIYGSRIFKGDVSLHAQKELRLFDADSSNYLALKAPATISADYTLTFPVDDGTSGQILTTNGSGVLSWTSALTNTLASGSIFVGIAGVATAVDTAAQGDITASSTGLNINAGAIVNADVNASAAIAYSKLNLSASIVNADVAAAAAIAYSKLAALTASRALVSDGSGFVSVSAVTSTELGYVSGVTSAIQTQLNAKASTATVAEIDQNVDDLITLSGVAENATSLGTFTGTIIPDTSTVKAALQSLETYVGALPDPMEYKGVWDASTNTPTLTDGGGNNGDVYHVSAAGTQFTPSISFDIGDKVVYNGATSKYEKWDMTDAVTSVNGSTGVVTVNAINQLTGDVTTSAASGSQSKVATIANDAVTTVKILDANVTNAKIASGVDAVKIGAGAVSNTEFGYLDGVTSAIQTQLDTKMRRVAATWANADGASKAVTHSLGTKDIMVQVYDLDDDSQIEVDSIVRTSTSVVTLSASQAPAVNWRVVVIG